MAIFIVIGLIASPFAKLAIAGSMHAASVSGMSDKMPCCPDKSGSSDCEKCALMAFCHSTAGQCLPTSLVVTTPPLLAQLIMTYHDPYRDGLGFSPPSRPPRFLVIAA